MFGSQLSSSGITFCLLLRRFVSRNSSIAIEITSKFLNAADDPRAFLLVEVYDSPEAAAAHKQTPHYLEWRKEVQDMMAEPRKAITYVARFPEDPGAGKMRLSEA